MLSSNDSWEQNLILASCVAGRTQDGGTELAEPLAALICASQQAEDHYRLPAVEGGPQQSPPVLSAQPCLGDKSLSCLSKVGLWGVAVST